MSVRHWCCALVGTAWSGPLYCGNPAKSFDGNGRPVCGIHKKGEVGIEWRGEGHRYPYGNGEGFRWRHASPAYEFTRRTSGDVGAPSATSEQVGQ